MLVEKTDNNNNTTANKTCSLSAAIHLFKGLLRPSTGSSHCYWMLELERKDKALYSVCVSVSVYVLVGWMPMQIFNSLISIMINVL